MKERKSAYIQSTIGLILLGLFISLFFYIANYENWYRMTSSCGHTSWISFFLFGLPLFGGAIAFEASALSHHRNPFSICAIIVTALAAIVLAVIYLNMKSTLSGC